MTSSNGNATTAAVRSTDIFQIFLLDEDGQNILGIDDGALRQSLRIEIVNTSGKTIEFKSINEQDNQEKYHFCISFRPGTLLLSQNEDQRITLKEANMGWQMLPQDKQGNTFYLSRNLNSDDSKVIENGKSITLTLENIGAAPGGGSRGTRVEIKYNNLQYQGSNETISGNRLQYLNIVNQRGKKQIPLYVGFLGSSTILNDGSENELTLSIQSLPKMTMPLIIKDYSKEIEPKQLDYQKLDGNPENLPVRTKIILEEISRISGIEVAKLLNILSKLSSVPGEFNLSTFISSLEQAIGKKSSTISNTDLLNLLTPSNRLKLQGISSNLNVQIGTLTLIINLLNFPNSGFDFSDLSTLVSKVNLQSILEKFKDKDFSTIPKDDLENILGLIKDFKLLTPESFITELSKYNIKIIDSDIIMKNQKLSLPSFSKLELLEDEAIKFTISFDVTTADDDSKHWALVEKTNADDIGISITERTKGEKNWMHTGKLEQGITPQWSFVCKKALQLTEREEILRLSIKNIKTRLLSGYANLYVHYENFPGYWDGYITVPIHKGPLVYRETTDNKVGCVGIGTDKPQAKLHVKSSTGVDGLKVEGSAEITGDISVGKKIKVEGSAEITGDISVGKKIEDRATGSEAGKKLYFRGAKENSDPIWISRFNEGNDKSSLRICLGDDGGDTLEIGYTDYRKKGKWTEALSVGSNGNTAIAGKVGIGTAPGSEQLKVQGDTAIAGNLSVTNGKVGIGTEVPDIELDVVGKIGFRNNNASWDHLYMNHDGAIAYINAGGAENGLALRVGTGSKSDQTYQEQKYTEIMRLLPSGNVGIGTNNPTAKLHVQGNTAIAGDLSITNGRIAIGKIPENGKLEIQQDLQNGEAEGIVLKSPSGTRQLRIGFDREENLCFYLDTPQIIAKGFYFDKNNGTQITNEGTPNE